MKTGRSRGLVAPVATGLTLSKSGDDLHLEWSTPTGDELLRIEAWNTVSGFVRADYAYGSDGAIDFGFSPSSGQSYFARVVVHAGAEPSPIAQSNTIAWP